MNQAPSGEKWGLCIVDKMFLAELDEQERGEALGRYKIIQT